MQKLTIVLTGLMTASSARADPPTKSAPPKLQGTYERVLSEAAHEMTEDKGSSCGDEPRAAIRKIAENVSSVTVLANSIAVNKGRPSAITFASSDVVVSNVVVDRDEKFTTALRLVVLDSGALVITRNRVERETADWCSDSFGVMIHRD
jgi:hypothetical protein